MSEEDFEELELSELVGRQVLSAQINKQKDAVLLTTESGPLYLTWQGECCSSCYIAHLNGSDLLVGSTILSIEHSEWSDVNRNSDECEVLESMGTKLKTSKGYVDVETRLDHNGYYSGEILISKRGFLGAYGLSLIDAGELEPLADF